MRRFTVMLEVDIEDDTVTDDDIHAAVDHNLGTSNWVDGYHHRGLSSQQDARVVYVIKHDTGQDEDA